MLGSADQDVVAAAGRQHVTAEQADEHVIARTADDHVSIVQALVGGDAGGLDERVAGVVFVTSEQDRRGIAADDEGCLGRLDQ